MKSATLLYTLFILLGIIACSAPKTDKIESEIGAVVFISFQLSDDVKPYLDSLQQIATATGDKKLLAYNDFVNKAWQLYYTNVTTAEKANLQSAIRNMAEQSPFADLRAHIIFWTGVAHIVKERKDDIEDLSLVLKGKKLLEEIHYETFSYAQDYYKTLSDIHAYFGDYDQAIYYIGKQLALQNSPVFNRHNLYNDLGTFYTRLGKYNKAEQAFGESLAICRQHHLVAFEGLVQSNLGNLERLKGHYKVALPYLYESIPKTEADIPESAAMSRVYLASCLLHLDSVNKAKEYLTIPSFKIPFWYQPGYNLNWFETQAMYYEQSGDLTTALRYKDSLIALKDSIKTERDNKNIIVLESSLQAERYINERKELENDRYLRNVVIIILLLLSVATVGWLLQRRRQEKRLAAQEQQHSKKMLAQANEQLNQYLQSIKEKNELIEQIRQQLESPTTNSSDLPEPDKENSLEKLQNSVLFTEQDWEKFKQLFEQGFPGFFSRLHIQYPDLSPAETRLLALEQLAITDREKGNMLNISADSVKKARYRLRKKYPGLLIAA